jgi:hypothetical protein
MTPTAILAGILVAVILGVWTQQFLIPVLAALWKQNQNRPTP